MPIEVKAYVCSHCGSGTSNNNFPLDQLPQVIKRHEKECQLNPDLKSCMTCGWRTMKYDGKNWNHNCTSPLVKYKIEVESYHRFPRKPKIDCSEWKKAFHIFKGGLSEAVYWTNKNNKLKK